MIFLKIFSLFFISLTLADNELDTCPEIKPFPNIDKEKFGGQWNVQYAYAPYNETIVCMTFEFELKENGSEIEVTEKRKLGGNKIEVYVMQQPMKVVGEVSYEAYTSDGGKYSSHRAIIDISDDYEQALAVECTTHPTVKDKFLIMGALLTKRSTPDPVFSKKCEDTMKNLGFKSEVMVVENVNCEVN